MLTGILQGVTMIVLNISVIVSVWQIPNMDKFSVTYMLLGNLALTDAGAGLVLLVEHVLPDEFRGFNYCLIFASK